jgi:hypothetical protein
LNEDLDGSELAGISGLRLLRGPDDHVNENEEEVVNLRKYDLIICEVK